MGEEANPDSRRICEKHQVPCRVTMDCAQCHGSGELYVDDDPGMSPREEDCFACAGTGLGFDECEYCLEEDDEF